MFNLFRRSKIAEWEKQLLINVFSLLSEQYSIYKEQVEKGLLNKVFFSSHPTKNYVGFSYNSIVSKYEKTKLKGFILDGISVFDKKINSYTPFRLHIYTGLIIGYSTPEVDKFVPDISQIKIENIKEIEFSNHDFVDISKILSNDEIRILNSDDVYIIELEGKKIYHLKDLEDGDFIGMDENKNIYEITHDPYEMKLLNTSLDKILK